MQFNPYLHFNGNCEEAFRFYEKVLNGKIDRMMTFDEAPESAETSPKLGDEWRKKIMHVRMTIGEGVLMGSDPPPKYYSRPQGFQVAIDAPNSAEADRIFAAFAEGGQVRMPLQQTFWAERFGMVTDRFGIPWMISCHKPAS